MFKNLTEGILWEGLPEAIQAADGKTSQRLVDGEMRGQTERYLRVLGSMLTELFSSIGSGFYSSDPMKVPFNSTDPMDGMLSVLQRRYNIQALELSIENEKRVRNVLDEAFNAWRLKGTQAFIYWILWKVFDWELTGIITLASNVLRCSVNGCTLYDPSLPEAAQKILYDETQLTPEDKTTVVIDVFHDPMFWEKRDIMLALMKDWGYPCEFKFVNTI